jgi:DNA-directed RNA polymerase subunit RPC12/RpoP
MSEFKFSCAHCGQHISADDSWAGRQIQCPNCQAPLVIPQMAVAAAPAAPRLSPAAAPPPFIPASQPAPAQALAAAALPVRELSMMALASLVLALATIPLNLLAREIGWPIGFLGCVPAVLCGHAALTELRMNRRKMGAPLAWIGLGLGYLALILGLVGVSIYGYRKYVKKEDPASARASSTVRRQTTPAGPNARPSPASPNQVALAVPVAPRPVDPRLTTNPLTAEIPDAPIAGKVRGRDFKPDAVAITGSGLTLKQGKEFFPDASVTLFLRFGAGEILDGRKLAIGPQAQPGVAYSIHVARKETKSGVPNTEIVTGNYAMRLEFGTRQGNKIPGKIYLELPQSLETKIAGNFEATVSR